MNNFITLYEHYCPFLQKNIVIEKKITKNIDSQDLFKQTNVCLNSHECNCGKICQNKLLDMAVTIRVNKYQGG